MTQPHEGIAAYLSLRDNYKAMEKAIGPVLSEAGISCAQWLALHHMASAAVRSASELARRLCHDSGATSRLLDRLEQRDLLIRRDDLTDRRQVDLALTDAGLALLRSLESRIDAALQPASRT